MMELKPEYQAIAAGLSVGYADHVQDVIKEAIKQCQALADRPPLMLMDDEICDLFNGDVDDLTEPEYKSWLLGMRKVIAGAFAKRNESTREAVIAPDYEYASDSEGETK